MPQKAAQFKGHEFNPQYWEKKKRLGIGIGKNSEVGRTERQNLLMG